MGKKEGVKFTFLGVRIGVAFLMAISILIFAAYVVVSQNVQNMLTDYTLKVIQTMVEQGVKTVEYELRTSKEESMKFANSFLANHSGEKSKTLDSVPLQSNILRIVYIAKEDMDVSDEQLARLQERKDIQIAFSGETAVYGPYFNEQNEFVVCYSAPVIQDNKVIGVLSIEKDGYIFCSLIKDMTFMDTGESYIINAEGTDIAVSEQSHIEWVNDQYNAEKLLAEQEDATTRSVYELEQKGLSGKTGIGTYYWDDGLCYLAYAPIPSEKWVLLVGIREEELSALTQSALYAAVAESPVFSSCISLSFVLTALIIFWIVSSFKRMSEMNKNLIILANYDPLTGALNRNSFHTAVDNFSASDCKSLVCVYIDANGLHEINNHLGHQAGDKMLKTVVEVLQRIFSEDDVYRIGGDEFVVFSQKQNYQEVRHSTEIARQELRKQGYEISIGIEWREKSINVQSMVNTAEESMKMDKQRYYQDNGKERQLRALDREFEKMVIEKQDADMFLSVLAPEFKGVYFVDLRNDTIRHLYIPEYFKKMLNEADGIFSKALSIYVNEAVDAAYFQQFENFSNFKNVEKQLNSNIAPELIYQKADGSWLKVRVIKFKTYTEQCKETLWIFSNVDTQGK